MLCLNENISTPFDPIMVGALGLRKKYYCFVVVFFLLLLFCCCFFFFFFCEEGAGGGRGVIGENRRKTTCPSRLELSDDKNLMD